MTNPDYLQPVDDGLPMREAGEWAAVKLDYLERYIHVFETSMREKKWRRRYYIDLFAGPGKNIIGDKEQVILGSPLIALTTKHPFTHYCFVEYDPDLAEALRTRCSASPHIDPDRDVIVGDCNEVVDTIAEEIARVDQPFIADQWPCLNLAFLDPEGLELEWRTIEKLARMKRMDLIIHFPIMALRRNLAGYYEMDAPTPADKFFGGDAWRSVYEQHSVQKARPFLDLYRQRLWDLGYVVSPGWEAADEVLIRSTKEAPLYYLMFASKDQLGHKLWREISRRNVWGQRRMF
jgi:three-Cys-motif partner protein